MPSRSCDVCRQPYTVTQKNWSLINYPGTFVCSKVCVSQWVHALPASAHPPNWIEKGHLIRSGCRSPDFISRFERVFSWWLQSKKLVHQYECLGFTVGESKVYIPDFIVHGRWCLLETKGKWSLGQKTKMKLFINRYPEIPLLVIPWVLRKEFYYGHKSGLSVR